MRNLVKLIMLMGMLIAVSPSLKAQDSELADDIAQCEAGDADFCHGVAMDYFFQAAPNSSLKSVAFDYFTKACDLGHSFACYLSGSYLTMDPDMAAFRGFQPDFDRGVGLLEKGCSINDSTSAQTCGMLAIFYFEDRYDAITLEQAYQYAMTECDDRDYRNCYALYYAYDKIADMPNVPNKEILLIRAAAARLAFLASIPPPLERMN